MRRIVFTNDKGGVGKTTTVANLAVGSSQRGKKTLVIDMDPQADVTYALLAQRAPEAEKGYIPPTTSSLLTGHYTIKQVILDVPGHPFVIYEKVDISVIIGDGQGNFEAQIVFDEGLCTFCSQARVAESGRNGCILPLLLFDLNSVPIVAHKHRRTRVADHMMTAPLKNLHKEIAVTGNVLHVHLYVVKKHYLTHLYPLD